MSKPIHAKPMLYAFYFEVLKAIALKYGYNLVLHGSMNRDLDLIAIPWQEEIKPHYPMIKEFAECLGGYVMEVGGQGGITKEGHEAFKKMFHGRESWIININRGIKAKYDGMVTEFIEHEDPQYYIDISVLPTLTHPNVEKEVENKEVNELDKTSYFDCNGCGSKKSVKIDFYKITTSGCKIHEYKCTECGKYNEYF